MKSEPKIGKSIIRIPPCPAYDIASTEAWLTEMAAKGWILEKYGFFLGTASFEYRGPQKVAYRVDVDKSKRGFFSSVEEGPSSEEREINEKFSWEYVTRRERFYIYRSFDPCPREMNTDPEVQAMALDVARKDYRFNLILCIFWIFNAGLNTLSYQPFSMAASMGSWWPAEILLTTAQLFIVIWFTVQNVRAFLHIKHLQRALTEGDGTIPSSSWRRRAPVYLTGRMMAVLFLISLVFSFFITENESASREYINLEEYSGTLPFATVKDLAGEGYTAYKMTDRLWEEVNTVAEASGALAPRYIDYSENASFQSADGKENTVGFYIDYYEMRSDWLARIVAGELVWPDKIRSFFNREWEYAVMDTSFLDADYAYAYSYRQPPTLIIRKGNIVMQAYWYGNEALSFRECAEILCESLQ